MPSGTFGSVDDGLLAARIRAGDDSALAEVFDRHAPLVLGLARRVTGNQSIAEDVVQEVFTTLWRQPDRYDPERGTLRAYLGVMAQRRSIDAVRRTDRWHQYEQKAEMPVDTGSDGADSALTAQEVARAIRRLPDDQRRAVELVYWQGLTHHEAAAALGVPEGTMKSRLRLAQAKLRDWLAPLGSTAV